MSSPRALMSLVHRGPPQSPQQGCCPAHQLVSASPDPLVDFVGAGALARPGWLVRHGDSCLPFSGPAFTQRDLSCFRASQSHPGHTPA